MQAKRVKSKSRHKSQKKTKNNKNMNENIKITFWNVNGINNKLRSNNVNTPNNMSIEDWIEIEEPDIIAIQETKKNENSTKIELDNNYKIYESRYSTNSSHNKVFFIKRNLPVIQHDFTILYSVNMLSFEPKSFPSSYSICI